MTVGSRLEFVSAGKSIRPNSTNGRSHLAFSQTKAVKRKGGGGTGDHRILKGSNTRSSIVNDQGGLRLDGPAADAETVLTIMGKIGAMSAGQQKRKQRTKI